MDRPWPWLRSRCDESPPKTIKRLGVESIEEPESCPIQEALMNSDETRSSRRMQSVPSPELDVELSALLDGELEDEAADVLRARMIQEPALAERLADLGAADGSLRQWGEEQLPSPERLIALRENLQAQIEAASPDSVEQPDSSRTHGARVFRLPVRWRAPVAAALAAGLALVILSRPGEEVASTPSTPPDRSLALGTIPSLTSEPPASLDVPSQRVPVPAEIIEPDQILARAPSPVETPEPAQVEILIETQRVVETTSDQALKQQPALETSLDEADETELAVVLEYEMLADLDVIENLDLLERLSILDGPETL
ncbi:MAG: hypothetical protein CBC48_00940 [bacterium TMED88]|nr:hypothetical protein [Deltaproteobacteria bacterium]OUV37216.1 MAG: hypothetical protein CBC48_00940 [bacterium TMED88]